MGSVDVEVSNFQRELADDCAGFVESLMTFSHYARTGQTSSHDFWIFKFVENPKRDHSSLNESISVINILYCYVMPFASHICICIIFDFFFALPCSLPLKQHDVITPGNPQKMRSIAK